MSEVKILLLISVGMLACKEHTKNAAPTQLQNVIDIVYDQFSLAYKTLDTNLVSALYEDQAIYLNPGDTIQFGKSEFISSFQDMF